MVAREGRRTLAGPSGPVSRVELAAASSTRLTVHSRLVDFEVALDFPLRDLLAVVVPLLPLGLEEPLVDVLTERPPHHVVALQLVERLVQGPRQDADRMLGHRRLVEVEE